MAYGFMFHALQEQAKYHGYLILRIDDGTFAIADIIEERLVSIEPNLDEVADLLGGICIQTAEERKAGKNFPKELSAE